MKTLKTTDGSESLEINWVISFNEKDGKILPKVAYKVVAVGDKYAFVIPFKEFKDIQFRNYSHRRKAYQGNTIQVNITSICNVHGAHYDNLDKETMQRRKEMEKKVAYAEELKKLKLADDVKDMLKHAIEEFEEELNERVDNQFDKALEELSERGQMFRGEWKEMTMSEIAIAKLNGFGKEGWKFAFELNGKFYFERPRKRK